MVYAPHTYLTFRGNIGGGTAAGGDMWQFGLRFRTVGTGAGTTVPQANVDKADAAARVFIAAAGAKFSTAVTLVETRGVVVGADGKALGLTRVKAPTTGTLGTLGTNLHPWSVSCVVTLDAGGARGGRFGRIYLPPQALSVSGSGTISAADATSIAQASKAFLDALHGPTTNGEELRTVVASSRFGTLRDVVNVRVGTVLDTQRRRDNRLAETYQVQALTA